MNRVAKYMEIASKSNLKYKQVTGVALADGGGQLTAKLCLRKLISSAPRNNQKQKFPKGAYSAPITHSC